MEISSKYVGHELKDYETVVTLRNIMNYAAAVSDNNPCYFDDERPEGIIAPPMFSVAITWPIIERIWDYIPIDDFPKEVLATQVHYTEHLRFFLPAKPGEKLKVKGRIAAILPHKAGTYIVIRFDVSNIEGEPRYTEHIGALLRGVLCVDDGQGRDNLPQILACSAQERPIWESTIDVDPLASYVYDGCTNIVFPIHTSIRFAHQVGLPTIILQGTATLAYAARELIDREAGRDPLALRVISCRFTDVVRPGDSIRVGLIGRNETDDGVDLFFVVLNSNGKRALSDAYASLQKSAVRARSKAGSI